MVFMVLHRHYTGFANVRIALMPQDHGEAGELRLASVRLLQHRIYRPNGTYFHTGIYIHLIDIARTHLYGCDLRLLTFYDYEYWFRFPTNADATIFYRMLCHKIDLIEEGDYDTDEEDYWEEGPWTVQEVAPERVE